MPRPPHPVAVLGSATLALALVELLGLGLVLLVWAAAREPWFAPQVVAGAVVSGLALGLAYGAAEAVGGGRGATRGLAVGLLLAPLPALAGAHALLRPVHGGSFEAVDALWRLVADPEAWRPAAVVVSLAASLHGPLLVARVAGRSVGAQSGALALGGGTWLAAAVALQGAWPVDLPLEAWVHVLLLGTRVAATAPALALADGVAERALRAVTGADAPAPAAALERDGDRPGSRWPALVVAAGALLATLACLTLARPLEPASFTALRLRAALGPEGRMGLVAALARPPRPRTARFAPLLGVAGALELHAPAASAHPDAWRDEAVELGWPEALHMARSAPRSRRPFERDELIAGARRSPRPDDPTLRRVLGELLLERRETYDDGWALLWRAAEQGDVRALLTCGRLRAPEEGVEHLRRAYRLAPTGPLRQAAAAALELLFDHRPALRSMFDPLEDLRVVDAAGRPLSGVVRLELDVPDGDGWGTWTIRPVHREVQGGGLVPGLIPGCRVFRLASFSFDAERAAAGIVDHTSARVAPGVVQVTLRPASDYGVLEGAVLDPAGRPVPGRDVLARDTRRGRRGAGLVTFTDPDGRFVFRDLPLSTYEVGLLGPLGALEPGTTRRAAPGAVLTLEAPAGALPAR